MPDNFSQQRGRKIDMPIVLMLLAIPLLLWGISKWWFVKNLSYFADIYAVSELASGWLDGRPLFYESSSGYPSYFHNTFLLLAFGPAAKFFGPTIFFWLQLALLALSLTACVRALLSARSVAGRQLHSESILFLFFITAVGPLAFWVWDHPPHGWHPEHLFLPLALFYAASVVSLSRAHLVWLLLIALVREDGPVVACALHLGSTVLRATESEPLSSQRVSLVWHISTIIIGWLLVFLTGLGILWLFGAPGSQRITQTLAKIPLAFEIALGREYVRTSLLASVIQIASLALPLCAIVGSRTTLIALACAVPVWLVAFISAFAYWPDFTRMLIHGQSWPPRFGTWLAVVIAIATIGLVSNLQTKAAPASLQTSGDRDRAKTFIIGVASVVVAWIFQITTLSVTRGYDFWARLLPQQSSDPGLSKRNLFLAQELTTLTCLNSSLPRGSAVRITSGLFPLLADHQKLFHRTRSPPLDSPSVIICDASARVPDISYSDCQHYFEPRIPDSSLASFINGSIVAYAGTNDGATKAALVTCGFIEGETSLQSNCCV